MKISDNKPLILTLAEDSQALDEIVVVGYGVQKKSVVTAAISRVTADELNAAKPSRVEDALKGKVSGVPDHKVPASRDQTLKCASAVSERSTTAIRYIS